MSRKREYLKIIIYLFLAIFFFIIWLFFLLPFDKDFFIKSQSLILTDRYGQELFEVLSAENEKNQQISIDQVSPYFIKALIAIEDKYFLFHQGIDFPRTFKALWENFSVGRVISGASTITQQLAKSLLNHQKRGLKEKILEIILALKLEKHFSKKEILNFYINRLPFGSIFSGISAACKGIFQTIPANLDLAQAAFLAGIIQSPEKFSPWKNFSLAKKRQEKVLSIMQKEKLISSKQLLLAKKEEIKISPLFQKIEAPHFVFYILKNFAKKITLIKKKGQSKLQTTLDLALQKQVETIGRNYLQKINTSHHISNFAVLVFEIKSGEILAFVGSKDFFDQEIDGQVDILTSYRQVGSTLKPFLYLLSFLQLDYNDQTIVLDEPVSFQTSIGTFWEPKNFNLTFQGEVTIRKALAGSLNIPATRVLEKVGLTEFLNFLTNLGLKFEKGDFGISAALGTPQIRLLSLAKAYGTLARGGQRFDFKVFKNEFIKKTEQIFPTKKALEIIDILADKKARIDSFGENSVLDFDFPVAVKTGTTRNFRDNFCVGFSSQIGVLVWTGNADGSFMKNTTGLTGAGPIFHKVLNLAMKNREGLNFTEKFNFQKDLNNFKTQDNTFLNKLRIIYPLNKSHFKLFQHKNFSSQKLKLVANKSCYWFVNQQKIGKGKEIFYIPQKGSLLIEARYEEETDSLQIFVE